MKTGSSILQKLLFLLCLVLFLSGGFWVGRFTDLSFSSNQLSFLSPLSQQKNTKELPLEQYSIPHLISHEYHSSDLTITSLIEDFPEYSSYEFSFTTLGKKMTGQINIPKNISSQKQKSILLVRGYVPLEIYKTGVGTKNAAAVFAKHGYITLAPDFFGYGHSDGETDDALAARFQKPIEVIELFESMKSGQIHWNSVVAVDASQTRAKIDENKIGIWAHSNGGQIALTSLEILGESIPTTLWAPVTAPFPYSVLFFTDEEPDEGKASRLWIAEFDRHYNAADFSLTQHVDRLQGPLQLHHGITDEAALKVWSDEFAAKIKKENSHRLEQKKQNALATNSAEIKGDPAFLQPISLNYFTYPNTDHNMKPSWDTVIQRDLDFFAEQLQ